MVALAWLFVEDDGFCDADTTVADSSVSVRDQERAGKMAVGPSIEVDAL